MKKLIQLLCLLTVLVVIISCDSESSLAEKNDKKENPLGLCDNEITLLKGDSTASKVNFDFYLSIKEELDFIQSQRDIDICNSYNIFSSTFFISVKDSIELSLFTFKRCDDKPFKEEFIRIHPPTIEVLINQNSQILIEGVYCSITEIDSMVYKMTKLEIIDGRIDMTRKNNILYYIQWDNNTPVNNRIEVFKEIIKGYLLIANEKSQEIYGKNICNLNTLQLMELKKSFNSIIDISSPAIAPEVIKPDSLVNNPI